MDWIDEWPYFCNGESYLRFKGTNDDGDEIPMYQLPTKIANSLQINRYCIFEEGLPIEYSEYHIKSLALIIPAPPFIFAAIHLTVEHSL